MTIKIRKLTPALAEDYVHFFDTTPHDDTVDEHKCYCVCWCNDDWEGKDFSTAASRRKYALQYVKNNNIQGYLAYSGDTIIGWCNTNTKSDCLKCASWQRFMDYVPLEESDTEVKVKSIFCFVIAPEMKRKGIATLLVERVCKDAIQDGFDFVEAYPYKESSYQSSDFGGHYDMYKKIGFYISSESEKGLVMRKPLK
ncbi:GNAT family N-acetyltransferase [Scatolibacter rhodanostii]|uniref:GNAT family N-acetyltransferase n=1 Tax=Scatolibacter rhodanostii TaxID=2014781 RepID=UPI000C075A02|nr:GNAT family N-acetyltransferase [Scatolibacter rhodanostii]